MTISIYFYLNYQLTLDSNLVLHPLALNPQANHRRHGLSFKWTHHLMHNQEAKSGHQDWVSQSPHHPKELQCLSFWHSPDLILNSINAGNDCLHFDFVWREFGLLCTHDLLNFLPDPLSTPNSKVFGADSTYQLLEYLCVSREITVPEIRWCVPIGNRYPHLFVVVSTCVIAKFT